jgi:hypothetical protein
MLLVLLYYMVSTTTTTTVTELSQSNGERQLGSQKSPITRPLNNRRAKSQESLMRKNPRVRRQRRHRSKTPSNSLLLHLQFTKVSTTQIFRNLTILLLAPKPHTTVVDTAIHAHYIAHHCYHHHHHHGATTTTALSSSSSRVPQLELVLENNNAHGKWEQRGSAITEPSLEHSPTNG